MVAVLSGYIAHFFFMVPVALMMITGTVIIAYASLTKPMFWAGFAFDVVITALAIMLVYDTYMDRYNKPRVNPALTPVRKAPRQQLWKAESVEEA